MPWPMLLPVPTPEDVLDFMGWAGDLPEEQVAQVAQATEAVTRMARAYTRGRGFAAPDGYTILSCEPDLLAVITTASARLASNPTNARRIEAGSFSSVPGTFEGWTLPELGVLHNYRRRTA